MSIDKIQEIIEKCDSLLNVSTGLMSGAYRIISDIRVTAQNILRESVKLSVSVLAICPSDIWDNVRDGPVVGWSGPRELTLQIPLGQDVPSWGLNVSQSVIEDPGEENWDFTHDPQEVTAAVTALFLNKPNESIHPSSPMTPLGFGLSRQPEAFEQEAYVYVQIREEA